MSKLSDRVARLQRLAAIRHGHLDVQLADWVFELAAAYERGRAEGLRGPEAYERGRTVAAAEALEPRDVDAPEPGPSP